MKHKNFDIDGIKCYMNREEAESHKTDIVRIVSEITEKLKDFGLKSVSFSDVSAETIQVNLVHEKVQGYYIVTVALKRDWCNVDEVIEDAVEKFKTVHIEDFQRFISDGERCGWD